MLPRSLKARIKKFLFSIDSRKLRACFEGLGLGEGAVVCAHSSLSKLGHIEGGPQAVIEALTQTVTKQGCVAMPAFSMSGTMKGYLDEGGLFDVRRTPSKVGLITEIFRRYPGVLRSLHPTHSVSAWGEGAGELVKDHERSLTPFGPATPYARLAEIDNGFLLMFGTRLLSLPHYLQERTDFPNLFLPEVRRVPVVDWDGNQLYMETKVMRPKVPFNMALPAKSGDEPEWCLLHDFCLLFPREIEMELKKEGKAKGYPKMWARRAEMERLGILRTAKLGRGEVGLLRVKPFVETIVPEMRDLIARFLPFYPKLT